MAALALVPLAPAGADDGVPAPELDQAAPLLSLEALRAQQARPGDPYDPLPCLAAIRRCSTTPCIQFTGGEIVRGPGECERRPGTTPRVIPIR